MCLNYHRKNNLMSCTKMKSIIIYSWVLTPESSVLVFFTFSTHQGCLHTYADTYLVLGFCLLGMSKNGNNENPHNVSNFLECVSINDVLVVLLSWGVNQTCIQMTCISLLEMTMNNNDGRFRNHFVFRQHHCTTYNNPK